MQENKNPLVTFALFSYNQEKYIGEAVEAVLEQNYTNLEIILSDDCSTDNTYVIMKNLVNEYNGPHRIILNRNDVNLGVGKHINKVMSISSGGLIVVGAGDDISLPNRVSEINNYWLSSDRKYNLISSSYIVIDEHGGIEERAEGCILNNMNLKSVAENGHSILGATAAWTKELWNSFNELGGDIVLEDNVMTFRACLMGGVGYINKPLLQYRKNVSVWNDSFKTVNAKEMLKRYEKRYEYQIKSTHASIKDAMDKNRYDLIPVLTKRIQREVLMYQIYNKNVGPLEILYEALVSHINIKRLITAILQVHAIHLYSFVLKRKIKYNEKK